MAATPEGRVKRLVKTVLAEFEGGLYVNWPVPFGYGESMLDCIGSIKGVHSGVGYAFAIETKAPGQDLTEVQERNKTRMEMGGMMVFVIGRKPETLARELDELRAWLRTRRQQ